MVDESRALRRPSVGLCAASIRLPGRTRALRTGATLSEPVPVLSEHMAAPQGSLPAPAPGGRKRGCVADTAAGAAAAAAARRARLAHSSSSSSTSSSRTCALVRGCRSFCTATHATCAQYCCVGVLWKSGIWLHLSSQCAGNAVK